MGVQTTSNLSNSQRAQFARIYNDHAFAERVYDRFAVAGEGRFIMGTQVIFPVLSKMDIGTTAISETVDIVPQTLRDNTRSMTPTSRGEALQQSDLVRIQSYPEDLKTMSVKLVSENALESIELLAQAAALKGGYVVRGAARASLDAGTSGHLFTEVEFSEVESAMFEMRVPGFVDVGGATVHSCAIHPDAYFDLRTNGNVVSIAQRQRGDIIMGSQEIGSIAGFRIMRSPWAKTFGAAGLDNGSNAATTLSAAVNKLATTMVVASATNISAGRYLTVGTEETGDTHFEGNERVRYISNATTTVTIAGAQNGGFRFDHASGVAVRNADSVYPVFFGGPRSLKVWFAPEVGRFGRMYIEEEQGLAHQWTSTSFKYFGNYSLLESTDGIRGEYASSLDA